MIACERVYHGSHAAATVFFVCVSPLSPSTHHPHPSVYHLAALLQAGDTTWDALDLDDVDVRLKWVGMFHRRKRSPGKV